MLLLQVTSLDKLPTFTEIIKIYGPYLGSILILIIVIVILQNRWFKKILNAKDEENKRLIDRENALQQRVLHMIDKEIGYRKQIKE